MSDYRGIRTMPGTTGRNGMPPSGGYIYKGKDIESPQEIVARLREEITARNDDLTGEPVPYWPAYYPGPGGES